MNGLTKPQLDLLTHAVASGRATCSRDYPPVKKLVALGLVVSHEGRLGGHWIEPTDAGVARLALVIHPSPS